MHLARDRIIPKCRRPLHSALDDRTVSPRPCPLAEESGVRNLDEYGFAGFVFHEAKEGRRVVGAVEREEVEVDDVGGGFVDVGLGRGKGMEVASVGVANADVGWGAGVAWVGGRVLSRFK